MQWLWGVLPACALSGGDGGEPQAARCVRGLGLGAVQSLGPVKRLLARTMMFGVR